MCTYLTTTKYAHCRKTKVIYRFDEEGFKKIKALIIDKNIQMIQENNLQMFNDLIQTKKDDTMKSRETLINDFLSEMEDVISEAASEKDVELSEEEEE